ncbi:MAG: Uma2 family endonuclease [Thermodesulfobacteriota bacterium]
MGPAEKSIEAFPTTYGDLADFPEGERWEIFSGEPFAMSPAPSRRHQEVAGELFRQIANALVGKECRPYVAPFDVRLPEENEEDDDATNVVQPDIAVICDPGKLDDRGCRGAPDWIIEVISPNTATNDYIRKVELYERHGVREYWIVHPIDQVLILRAMEETGRYGFPVYHPGSGRCSPRIFPGLELDLDGLFGGGD